MKRRVQERGELDWSAEDLIELQSQPFEMIDAIYSIFGNIVVSGCNVVDKTIGSGVVILDGKIMPFEETRVKTFPCYITSLITPIDARYVDGLLKPVSYEYKGVIVDAEPIDKKSITVTADGVDKLLKRSSDLSDSDSSETVATSKALKNITDKIGGKADSEHTHNYEPIFSKNSAFNKNFGSSEDTVCQGNDARLSDARPASDVPQWAKSSTKPSYTASEVGAASSGHAHSDYQNKNDSRLQTASKNIVEAINTLNSSSAAEGHTHDDRYEPIFSKNSAFNKDFGFSVGTVCQGNDARLSDARPASDVSQWAKASVKPSYSASEVGAASSGHYHSDYEPAFYKNNAFNRDFGSSSGTVCQGNDARLSDARPASDVSQWAKASIKPSYTASEVGAAQSEHQHSNLANIDLSNATLIKSLTSNGYYKAPDGLMMQWGKKTSSNSVGSIYFPISFTELFSVTTAVSDVSLNYGYGAYVNYNSTSRFDYRVAFTGSGGVATSAAETFYWIAIGRWK